MEPVRLRLGELPEDEIARRVAFTLEKGGIALLPAEGVYGFHTSSGSAAALARILTLKGKGDRAGFIGLIADPEDAARWARVEPVARELARTHWPGALTLVLDALPVVPPALRSEDGTIALRCPGTSFLRAVVAALDRALGSTGAPILVLSTSANIPGFTPARQLQDAPTGIADLAVDGGILSGTPSTLVRVSGPEIRLLRQGAVIVAGGAR